MMPDMTTTERRARMTEPVMTLNEAADELGLDPSTLRHQIRNGQLHGRKIGPIWTVTVSEVERYRTGVLGHTGRRPKV